MKREESRYIKRRRGAVFRNCCQRFPKISQGSQSGTLSNFLRKFLSCWLGSDPFRTDKLRVVFIHTTYRLYTNVMLFFLEMKWQKTLSLTWSKKNLIGPEALHQDQRPKTQDPSPSPSPSPSPRPRRAEPSRAEPSRPDVCNLSHKRFAFCSVALPKNVYSYTIHTNLLWFHSNDVCDMLYAYPRNFSMFFSKRVWDLLYTPSAKRFFFIS